MQKERGYCPERQLKGLKKIQIYYTIIKEPLLTKFVCLLYPHYILNFSGNSVI